MARAAGVSPALVSYVLNDGPRPVSAEARSRIERAIDDLGYRPNTIAQALRGQATRTIALLTPSPTNPFFAELARAVESELFARGNILSIGITDDDPEREERYIRSFLDRQVDAIILITTHTARTLSHLAGSRSPTPVLVLDRLPAGGQGSPAVSTLQTDNEHGAHRAVSHLHGHGHRVVACLAGRSGMPLSQERVAGWRAAQTEVGGPTDTRLVAYTDFTPQGGAQGLASLLDTAGGPTPTALFASSDYQALGVLAACRDRGIRVPEDLAVASFDGTRIATLAGPLTSYRQPIGEIAGRAVRHLLDRVADPGTPPAHDVLTGNLVIGRSCGCGAGHPADVAGTGGVEGARTGGATSRPAL